MILSSSPTTGYCCELHFATRHAGKGAVVREAWALAPEADWLAFVDADGSRYLLYSVAGESGLAIARLGSSR